jgi:hypothetical protein
MAFINKNGNAVFEVITDEGGIKYPAFNNVVYIPTTEKKLTAINAAGESDAASNDYFGYSVAVGSGRIVVGSYGDGGNFSGSAYVFDLDGNLIKKLTASDAASYDYFGRSVAVGSGRIVVGADGDDNAAGYNSGSAYVFDLGGNLITKLTPGDTNGVDHFGCSVAVGSGRIVVGADGDNDYGTGSGAAYVFDLGGDPIKKLTAINAASESDAASYNYFGNSVAVGNGRIVVGAYKDDNDAGTDSGSAYVFDLGGKLIKKLTASDAASNDYFGHSVAVGSGRIVVGAYGDGYAGSAYIFDLGGKLIKKLTASDAATNVYFGYSVAVGSSRIVVGAYLDDNAGTNFGAAYVFDLDGNELKKLTAIDAAAGDYFGNSVAVGSGRIVVGAYLDDDTYISSGSAYMYKLDENYDIYIESILDSKQI